MGVLTIDTSNLAETGWGVVFPTDGDGAIKEALQPLLDLRRYQSGEYFRVLEIRPGESAPAFFGRYGASLPDRHPRNVPFYLLLAASPTNISFDTENAMAVASFVGRLSLPTLDDYSRYANAVVQFDSMPAVSESRAVFFLADHSDDPVLAGAANSFATVPEAITRQSQTWSHTVYSGADSTKGALLDLLGGASTPDLLVTLTHGLCYRAGDPLQQNLQGGLVCSAGSRLPSEDRLAPRDFSVGASDIAPDADLRGMIGLHLASYSAGTSQLDSLGVQMFSEQLLQATQPFISGLSQRLLSTARPARAFIGQLDRLVIAGTPEQRWSDLVAVTREIVTRIARGERVGQALNSATTSRYASLAVDLASTLQRNSLGLPTDDAMVAVGWARKEMMRGFTIIGDPAVRLPHRHEPRTR